MSYSVIALPHFRKRVKKLAKKYPSLKADLAGLIEQLQSDPKKGTPLGHHCYKIRMAIASRRKGKSGGSRVITYFQSPDSIIYLLTIYDKSKAVNITDSELLTLLRQIPE